MYFYSVISYSSFDSRYNSLGHLITKLFANANAELIFWQPYLSQIINLFHKMKVANNMRLTKIK